ncbi:hypothetical protein MGMO_171c00120 [Methyloglobulus morosus KoM1]|uniref:Uncharacterized protein n=1 Tax=Methyloglobulus morosus KoM1 TaxID=1116472 RepID=V5B1Y7_9GAMM|nr:hypothetical protein [Methyloglobulus morosus]ESS67170.1 hypothetical protein MGMO_171c00120 [Methyloglobulus morosus KoM1]
MGLGQALVIQDFSVKPVLLAAKSKLHHKAYFADGLDVDKVDLVTGNNGK